MGEGPQPTWPVKGSRVGDSMVRPRLTTARGPCRAGQCWVDHRVRGSTVAPSRAFGGLTRYAVHLSWVSTGQPFVHQADPPPASGDRGAAR